MPSFGDTALIALIALLLFGPKKLPELARQLGKLMGEFRRASNEFRMQMEDELRISEQEERQKKIAAMEAAAPVAPPLLQDESIVIDHPHMPVAENTIAFPTYEEAVEAEAALSEAQKSEAQKPQRHTAETPVTPLPIATSGDLSMMPPSTGLPVGRSPLAPVFDAIPHTPDPETTSQQAEQTQADHSSHEASLHG